MCQGHDAEAVERLRKVLDEWEQDPVMKQWIVPYPAWQKLRRNLLAIAADVPAPAATSETPRSAG